MPADANLCFTPARKLAGMIRSRKLSATELTRAFIAQIERVNPKVNAIVTFAPEAALKAARAIDRRKPARGMLAGLPIAYKDLIATKGMRTTFGSPLFAHNVPQEDHALVTRLAAEGAITIGKTNTPEFGAGSQTFNKGLRRNPQSLRSRQDLRRLLRAAPRCASLAACCHSPTAPTSRRACAIRGATATSSASVPRPGRVPAWPAMNAWNTLRRSVPSHAPSPIARSSWPR
jgi:amidase